MRDILRAAWTQGEFPLTLRKPLKIQIGNVLTYALNAGTVPVSRGEVDAVLNSAENEVMFVYKKKRIVQN